MAPSAQEKPHVGRHHERRLLEVPEGLVHRYLRAAAAASSTVGVRMTISSSPVLLVSPLLKRQPSPGTRPNTGTSRVVMALLSFVTPPTTSRWPWLISTSVSWRRLKIEGLPRTDPWPEKSGSVVSN